jgi:hypothetical protein
VGVTACTVEFENFEGFVANRSALFILELNSGVRGSRLGLNFGQKVGGVVLGLIERELKFDKLTGVTACIWCA